MGTAPGGRRPLLFAPPPAPRAGASVGEAIHEAFAVPGSPGQRFVVARIGSLVATVLGAGIALALLRGHADAAQRVGAVGTCLAGIVAGQVLPRRALPLWAMDLLLFGAGAVLAVAATAGGPLLAVLPAVYVSLGTAVFVIRPLRSSLRHLAGIGVGYAVVLAFGPDQSAPATRWLVVMAAVAISGRFARWLVGRVTDLATAEHAARLEVERSTEELEGQSRLKTAFLARMSHELRTPLNVVVGFADVLRDGTAGPLTDAQRGHVEDIAASGRDLLALVDELLDVTKVEQGALGLVLTQVDVAEAVADAELLVEGRAREAGVALHLHRPLGPVLADADALRIRQVAWNLVGNAVKFTPRGGSVTVTVSADDAAVQVVVRDTGPGIDPEDQARIFEPYEQGEHRQGGSGIGLALSRRLIEAHGGRLEVESRPGQGATFRCTLPRHQAVAAPGEPPPVLDPEPSAWTELDQAILVPGSLANRRAVAQVGGWFATSAALLLPVVALITPGPVGLRAATAGVAVLAAAMSRLLGDRAEALPLRTIELLGVFGTLAVSAGVLVAGPFAALVALTYGWNTLVASALLPPLEALAQALLVVAAYAVVLLVQQPDGALDRWIGITMLVAATSVVIAWVAGRLREVLSEALRARLAAEAARFQVAAVSTHKSDFLAHTSHELCTPLNAIIGFAQVLRDGLAGPLDAKQASYVEDVLEAGQHLLALITDLLDLAKVEAGRVAVRPRPVAAATVIETAAAEVLPLARRRGIELRVAPLDGLPTVEADPTHLYHALANLLANAVKFTSDGGRVDVRARVEAARLLISVQDTGLGIVPDQLPHLFEAFHQGTRPLPAHALGGTGLGLTLAKELVELQRGEIHVESTPDVGSTFTIVLATPGRGATMSTEARA